MAIENINNLVQAMGNNSSRFIIDKASVASQAVGTFVSLWRAAGQPGQGAIPAATATCNNTTFGGMNFTQQTSPASSYGAYLEYVSANALMTLEIHDRLAHMGGLSGTVTTAQTVNIDLDTLGATDNVTQRLGDTNFSDVQWWLEWYTATGATVVTATVNVTYDDASTGNLTAVSLAATRPASFMQSLNLLVPAAKAGLFIRGVNSVTLSATTGTAGSFGVTATRARMTNAAPVANFKNVSDWQMLGLPEIYNSSCLFPIVLTSTTSSGTARASGKIAHG